MNRQGLFADPLRRVRVLVATVVVIAAAGLVALLVWRGIWPAMALNRAEQALARNDSADARVRLDRYVTQWPHDQRAMFLAAQASRRCDAYADAERWLTAFEEAAGPTDESKLEWKLLGIQQGDFAGDEKWLRSEAESNGPNTKAILEALAKGYFFTVRWSEAIVVLNRLLQLDPDYVPALILRATISDEMHQSDSAEKDLRHAVDVAPTNPAARTALAGQLTRHGYAREAIAHFETSLQFAPGDHETLLGLARALTDFADMDGAERRLDELLAVDPDHAEALVERSRLALRRNRPDQAEPFLARGVKLAPWHRDANDLYYTTLKDLGRTEAAAQCKLHLAELLAEDRTEGRLKLRAREDPADLAIRMELSRWCSRNGQSSDGLVWLGQVLRASPQHPEAHAAVADYFERAGQPRRAAMHRKLAAKPN